MGQGYELDVLSGNKQGALGLRLAGGGTMKSHTARRSSRSRSRRPRSDGSVTGRSARSSPEQRGVRAAHDFPPALTAAPHSPPSGAAAPGRRGAGKGTRTVLCEP